MVAVVKLIDDSFGNVIVQEGQVVAPGQKIGEVATDADGTSEVNFQVWKNASKQNPELWLKAR